MARTVVWSKQAAKHRINILKYWLNRNQSTVYPQKLNRIFKETEKLLALYPYAGTVTDNEDVRACPVKDYIFFYKVTDTEIVIISLWDTRQDPEKLSL